MKNFKRILAVVLAVLFVVPGMAFGASAEVDALAANWTSASFNNLELIDAAYADYNHYMAVDANEDGSISVSDASVAFAGAFAGYPMSKISANAPDYFDGSKVVITPVGYDVDGDEAVEYAKVYSIMWTTNIEGYNDDTFSALTGAGGIAPFSLGLDRYGHMYDNSTIEGENSFVVVYDEYLDLGWYTYPNQTANDNVANYALYHVVSGGGYWGGKEFRGVSLAVDFTQPITTEIQNYWSEDDEEQVLCVLINGEPCYTDGFGDAYTGQDDPNFYVSIAAYGAGLNAYNAAFQVNEINGYTDVVNYNGIYCDEGCTFGEWSEATAATCTEDGIKTRTCSVCPRVETEVVEPALGHEWSDWTVDVAADCDTDGSKSRACSVCGEVETEVVPALGHDYSVYNYIVAPTPTVGGTAVISCANCGDVPAADYIVDVPATGYWVEASFNNLSLIDASYAEYNNYMDVVANEDGSLGVYDASVAFGGAFAGYPMSKVTTTTAAVLNGSKVVLTPVGADVDGDGENEYAKNYSILWTNRPENYNGLAYSALTGAGGNAAFGLGTDRYGHMYDNSTTAGEYSLNVVYDEYLDLGWYTYPNQTANDNIANYALYHVVSGGNYWAGKEFRGVSLAVDFTQPITTEVENYWSEDDEEQVLCVLINGEPCYTESCGNAYEGLDDAIFYTSVAAYGAGLNAYNASFEINEINGATDVANYCGAYSADVDTKPVISTNLYTLNVENATYVRDIFIISGTGYTTYKDVKAARDTAAYYNRETINKMDQNLEHSYSIDLPVGEYSVVVRLVDGTEYGVDITASAPQAEISTKTSGRVKIESFDMAIKTIRLAPGTGYTTVKEIKNAEGALAYASRNFKRDDVENSGCIFAEDGYDSIRLFPAPGTYTVAVEFVDGSVQISELVLESKYDYDIVITAEGISDVTVGQIVKIRYAAGEFASEAEAKAAGSKIIYGGAHSTYNYFAEDGTYTFKAPLEGTYTFFIDWEKIDNTVITLTF